MNGSVLVSERNAWLDEEVGNDPSLRRLYKDLWRELESEKSAFDSEQRAEAARNRE